MFLFSTVIKQIYWCKTDFLSSDWNSSLIFFFFRRSSSGLRPGKEYAYLLFCSSQRIKDETWTSRMWTGHFGKRQFDQNYSQANPSWSNTLKPSSVNSELFILILMSRLCRSSIFIIFKQYDLKEADNFIKVHWAGWSTLWCTIGLWQISEHSDVRSAPHGSQTSEYKVPNSNVWKVKLFACFLSGIGRKTIFYPSKNIFKVSTFPGSNFLVFQ